MILTLYSFINFKFLFVYLNTKDMETGWLKEIQRHTGNVSGVCCLKQIKRKRDLFLHCYLLFFFGLHFCNLCKEVNLPADGTTVLLCIHLPLQVHDGKYVAKREGIVIVCIEVKKEQTCLSAVISSLLFLSSLSGEF